MQLGYSPINDTKIPPKLFIQGCYRVKNLNFEATIGKK